jgi:hypothetical protein
MKQIIERVKAIVLKPRETWETIQGEDTTIPELLKNYLLILAAVPAVASLLGKWIIGIQIPFVGVYRFSFGASLVTSVLWYVFTIAGIWLAGKVTSYLAPNFGSTQNDVKGFQVAVFCYTPYLAAGVLNIIPALGVIVFLAGLYGLYLLYIGLPILMNTPKEKSLPYTITIIVVMILIYIIVSIIIGAIHNIFGPALPKI